MKISIIGCGVMGRAFSVGLASYSKKYTVCLFDKNLKKAEDLSKEVGGIFFKTIDEAILDSDIIILAVKKKDLQGLSINFKNNQVLISILAGVSIDNLKKIFPKVNVVRLMPNLPLMCGFGLIVGCCGFHGSDFKKFIGSVMSIFGKLIWVETEDELDKMTAISGCGPGFVGFFMEIMFDAAIKMGINKVYAEEYILKIFEGTVELLKKGAFDNFTSIKNKVSSPGGATEAGLVYMEDSGVRKNVIDGIFVAYQKCMDLSK